MKKSIRIIASACLTLAIFISLGTADYSEGIDDFNSPFIIIDEENSIRNNGQSPPSDTRPLTYNGTPGFIHSYVFSLYNFPTNNGTINVRFNGHMVNNNPGTIILRINEKGTNITIDERIFTNVTSLQITYRVSNLDKNKDYHYQIVKMNNSGQLRISEMTVFK
ncbi:MAG: hypothetical protein LBC71_06735 [Oscillospiraceae bacterium]|jgi:hypothetical protein|nr:hypothetical protein [Oscillospiraceae bacterium]